MSTESGLGEEGVDVGRLAVVGELATGVLGIEADQLDGDVLAGVPPRLRAFRCRDRTGVIEYVELQSFRAAFDPEGKGSGKEGPICFIFRQNL